MAILKKIILDRDGVINELKIPYVLRIEQFTFIPGSLDALRLLSEDGIQIAVVSNQACLGKGLISKEELDRINYHICSTSGADIEFFYCGHVDSDFCNCRKPQPGNLLQAKGAIELQNLLFVGDNASDRHAAAKIKMNFCFVETGHFKQKFLSDDVCAFNCLYHLVAALRKANYETSQVLKVVS